MSSSISNKSESFIHTLSPPTPPLPSSPSLPIYQPPQIASVPATKRTAPSTARSPISERAAFKASHSMSEKLGEYIVNYAELLARVGWTEFVRQKRVCSDLASLQNVHHSGKCLLTKLKIRGATVRFHTQEWSRENISTTLARGSHKSCMEYLKFLHEEFTDMIQKGQWVILPANSVVDLPGLQISPPGVIPQRERRPHWICDYTWYGVNADTLPLVAM